MSELVDAGLSRLRAGLFLLGKSPELPPEESQLADAVEWSWELCSIAEGLAAMVKQHVDARAESAESREATETLLSISRRLRDSIGSMSGATQEMRLAVRHAAKLRKTSE